MTHVSFETAVHDFMHPARGYRVPDDDAQIGYVEGACWALESALAEAKVIGDNRFVAIIKRLQDEIPL